jgi:hypothetical protein
MHDWKTLARLLADGQAEGYDVAAANLACAAGLPGAPTPEQVAECLDRLDHYARCAAHYTQRRLPEFRRDPGHYDNSEGIFRVVCLVTLLQDQFGVRYHPGKRGEDAVFDTADVFIHGALLGKGGTCASLPVVYAAVGRLLGYPLRLVHAMRHCFVRWDDPAGERFNVEVNDKGVGTPPDDYYRRGRYAVSAKEESLRLLLKSLTPREELAGFLTERALLFRDAGVWGRATAALAWAWQLVPENVAHRAALLRCLGEWKRVLDGRTPPGFPEFHCRRWHRQHFRAIPEDVEESITFLAVKQDVLDHPKQDRDWWEPMRRAGGPIGGSPALAVVEYGETSYEVHFMTGGQRLQPVTERRAAREYDPVRGRWFNRSIN